MGRGASVWCGVAVMVASWVVATPAVAVEGCEGGDRVQVNVVSPQPGETYEARVPLRFVIDQPRCDVAFRLIIDGREYQPTVDEDGQEHQRHPYRPVRGGRRGGPGEFGGCRSGPRVWRGSVELPPGEHHLTLDGCPQGTNVAAAFSEPRVVHFATAHNSAGPLPDTGVNIRLLMAGISSAAFGVACRILARFRMRPGAA